MKFDEVIRGRRSIRTFKDKDIPNPVIEDLLNLAMHAPSSMNGQPWQFIVIRDMATKKKLVEIKNKYCPVEPGLTFCKPHKLSQTPIRIVKSI